MKEKLCTRCGEARPISEFYTNQGGACKLCRSKYNKERYAKLKADGVCTKCGKPTVGTGIYCAEHRRKNGEAAAERLKYRRKNGLCERCGKYPARSGRTICKQCAHAIARIHAEQKLRCIEYLGGKCTDCGLKTENIAVYEFHHVGEKDANVSRLLQHAWDVILKELDKCVLLCANCHRTRHAHDWGEK